MALRHVCVHSEFFDLKKIIEQKVCINTGTPGSPGSKGQNGDQSPLQELQEQLELKVQRAVLAVQVQQDVKELLGHLATRVLQELQDILDNRDHQDWLPHQATILIRNSFAELKLILEVCVFYVFNGHALDIIPNLVNDFGVGTC